jgi:hypothetical protein
MSDLLTIDVSYVAGHWVAAISPYYTDFYEGPTLAELIHKVWRARPEETLEFIVDAESVEGQLDLVTQIETSETDAERLIFGTHYTSEFAQETRIIRGYSKLGKIVATGPDRILLPFDLVD